jgi:hypothetical protein
MIPHGIIASESIFLISGWMIGNLASTVEELFATLDAESDEEGKE